MIIAILIVFFIILCIAAWHDSQTGNFHPPKNDEYDEDYENDVAMTNLYLNEFLDNDDTWGD